MAPPPEKPDPRQADPGAAGPSAAPEDLVYGVAAPDPDALPRRPLVEPPRAEVLDEDVGEVPEPPPGRRPFQFTLSDLLILTTGLAVFLSAVVTFTWRWSIAAGLSGFGAFAATVVLVQYEPEHRAVRAVCWSLLGFYVLTCVAAICTGR